MAIFWTILSFYLWITLAVAVMVSLVIYLFCRTFPLKVIIISAIAWPYWVASFILEKLTGIFKRK